LSAFEEAVFGAFGLLFGSFLTVLIHRTPLRESVVRGRSRCPACGIQIRARDNIPLLSWLVLRGRCRDCGARISARYPLTELAGGALFAGAARAFPDTYVAAAMAVFLGLMLALALIDLEHRNLPNAVVYPSLALFALVVITGGLTGRHVNLVGAAIGFVALAGGLLFVALAHPGAMGIGDVKLAALIGLVLGAQGLQFVAVAASSALLASGVGGVVAVLGGRSRKDAIPFGPFLSAGAVVAAFLAPRVAGGYLSIFR
jgi:leader peptidase (prepilin peptidase) / N-methyltransferase